MSATPSPLPEATKKCPHCEQWTTWQQQPTDHCQHCGQELEPYRAASNEARAQLEQQPMSKLVLIEVKPDDGTFMRFLKRIIQGGQLAFAGLLAFVVWFLTTLAG